MRPLRNKTYLFSNCKAQALLELAIFGSIILMLLGVLINYGLRYNYQQQAEQRAYRRALAKAYSLTLSLPAFQISIAAAKGEDPVVGFLDYIRPFGSGSYVITEDKHIPDPANPWGIGSVVPISASASVARDEQMSATADFPYELPEMTIDVNGKKSSYKTAGMRLIVEWNQPGITKIYGQVTGILSNIIDDYGEDYTLQLEPGPMLVIDSADGELVNYATACYQCRQLMDPLAYEKERLKEIGPETIRRIEDDNDSALEELWGSIWPIPLTLPWYCEGGYPVNSDGTRASTLMIPLPSGAGFYAAWGGRWYFPKLDDHENGIFRDATYTAVDNPIMGVQSNFIQTLNIKNKLEKTETLDEISVSESIDYVDTIERKLLYVNRRPVIEVDLPAILNSWEVPWINIPGLVSLGVAEREVIIDPVETQIKKLEKYRDLIPEEG